MQNFATIAREIVRKNKTAYLKSLVFIMLLTIVQAGIPLAMRAMLSELELKRSMALFVGFILLYMFMQILSNLFNVGWFYMLDILGGYVLESVRLNLCKSVYGADYRFVLKYGKERLKNTFFTDTINIYSCAVLQSLTIVSNLVLLMVYLLVTAYFSPLLSGILLAAALCDFALSMLSRRKITACSAAVNREMKEDNRILSECVDSIELAKQNDVTEYLYARCQNGTRNFIKTAMKADAVMIFLRNLNSGFNQVVSFAVSAFLIMTMEGSSAGDLVYCLFVSGAVLGVSQTIENAVYMLMKNSSSFDNVAEVSALETLDGEVALDHIESIVFDHVTFSYGEGGGKILDGTSFTLKSGDIICLKGANGKGKSTIFKLMTRLVTADSGCIRLNGIPIENVNKKSLNRQICYIGQDEILLNGTVENYLEAISGQAVSEQELHALEDAVKLDRSVQMISDNGNALSGGQRKKLLMMKMRMRWEAASVILIDELEAGLDAETQRILSELEHEMIRSNRNKMIVKISHTGTKEMFTGQLCL